MPWQDVVTSGAGRALRRRCPTATRSRQSVRDVFAAGKQNDVPTLTGSERGRRRRGAASTTTLEAFQREARQRYGDMADEFLALYPAATDEEAGARAERQRAGSGARDPLHLGARSREDGEDAGVHLLLDPTLPGPDADQYGAFHTSEVPYVLNTLSMSSRPFTRSRSSDRRYAVVVLGQLRGERRSERQGIAGMARRQRRRRRRRWRSASTFGRCRSRPARHGSSSSAASCRRAESLLYRAASVLGLSSYMYPAPYAASSDPVRRRVDLGTCSMKAGGRLAEVAGVPDGAQIIFDGIDNQLLGVSIPTMMKEWSVPRGAFAPVVALGYFGMMLGGAAAGLAGDRFGRRTALLASMACSARDAWPAFVHDTGSLAILRFLAGIGLGGAIPNAAALAAEYMPRPWRSIAVTLTIVCVPLGATIAGLLGSPVLAHSGWRLLFLIGGGVPLVSPRCLSSCCRNRRATWRATPHGGPNSCACLGAWGTRSAIDVLIRISRSGRRPRPIRGAVQQDLRRDTLALWGSFLSCLLAVYLGFSWLPSVLTGAGFTPAVASNGITAFNLGGVVGAIAGGLLFAHRLAPRDAGYGGGAIAGAVALSLMTIDAGWRGCRCSPC